MKNKTLIVTQTYYDFTNLIERYVNNEHIIWLQLWPVLNEDKIRKLYPNIEIIKSNSLISNNDHKNIANFVFNTSNNWWELLGLNEQEWEIDGLKISQLYSYEIEQSLTNLLFKIKCINNILERFIPDKIVFFEEDSVNSNDLYNPSISLSSFYSKYTNSVLYFKIQSKNKRKYFNKVIKVIKKNTFYELITKFKPLTNTQESYSIVISSSDRCLQRFNNIVKKKHSVFIMNKWDIPFCIDNKGKVIPEMTKDIVFDDISLNNFFKIVFFSINNNYQLFIDYYYNQIKIIEKITPKMYITVNLASSKELVRLWAFKKSGVRTILASEGLGQPNSIFKKVVNSVLHPELSIERWVVSKHFKKEYYNDSDSVSISGYLDESIMKKCRDIESSTNRSVVYALSTVNPNAKRAILGEDIFEMLESVSKVAEVCNNIDNCNLTIRLHPGDSDKISLFKHQIRNFKRVKISIFEKLDSIICKTNLLIIYDTSVGLESLIKGKNVICYNYTQRPSYITSIYDYVNHDPDKGAALVMANNKTELQQKIDLLLHYGGKNIPSPNMQYVLENANADYDVEKVVNDLIL